MNELIGWAVAILAWAFGAAIALFVLYALFVFVPVDLYTEAQCLRQGYQKHAVSVGLERYCINLDGSVTVSVDHQ